MQLTQSEARRRITGAFQPEPFSLFAAVRQMYEGGLRAGGPEYDTAQQLAEESGQLFDANRIALPWSALGLQQRDLTKGTATAGGYLVGTDNLPTATSLNGASLAQESGATIRLGMRGDVTVPRITARPTTYWLADEATEITPSQPAIGAQSATPKSVAALVTGTRLLRVQSTELIDVVLQREFAGAIWLAIDTAIVQGSGNSGQPYGLASMLTPTSGTSLSWASVLDMKKSVTTAGGRGLSVWAGPAAEKVLRNRERFSGAGAIWADNGVGGLPSYATPAMPDATLLLGDFSTMTVLVWGYPRLELNPYADAAKGLWQARLIVDCDFLAPHLGAFAIATALT